MANAFILWVRRYFLAIFHEGRFSFSLQALWITLMPIPSKEVIFSLSYLPVQIGFFIRAFWMSRKALGLSLRLWATRFFLALMGLAGFFLAKLRMRRRELSEIFSCFLIFLRGTWVLES
jgi:hypothetical protein